MNKNLLSRCRPGELVCIESTRILNWSVLQSNTGGSILMCDGLVGGLGSCCLFYEVIAKRLPTHVKCPQGADSAD